MCSPYCGGPQSTIVCLELSRRRRLGFGHLHGSLEKRMKLGAFFSISSNVEGVVTVEKLSVGVLQQGLVTLLLLLSSSFLSFLSSLLPLLSFLPSLLLGLLKNDVNERGRWRDWCICERGGQTCGARGGVCVTPHSLHGTGVAGIWRTVRRL